MYNNIVNFRYKGGVTMDTKDRIKELRTSKGWILEELGNKLVAVLSFRK